jgi:hypothetical protein
MRRQELSTLFRHHQGVARAAVDSPISHQSLFATRDRDVATV